MRWNWLTVLLAAIPLGAQCVLNVEVVLGEERSKTVHLVNRGASAITAFAVYASARRGHLSESSSKFTDAVVIGQSREGIASGASQTIALRIPDDGSVRAGAVDEAGSRCGDEELAGFLFDRRVRLRQDLPSARERLARLRADGASVEQIREAFREERRVGLMNAALANATGHVFPAAMAWHVSGELRRIEKATPNIESSALLDQLDRELGALSVRLDLALRH